MHIKEEVVVVVVSYLTMTQPPPAPPPPPPAALSTHRTYEAGALLRPGKEQQVGEEGKGGKEQVNI